LKISKKLVVKNKNAKVRTFKKLISTEKTVKL